MANVNLKVAADGKEVEFLQTWLNALVTPLPKLTVSGKFDASTRAAVIKYQGKKHLKADGEVGSFTWWEIMNDIRVNSGVGISDPDGTPQWLKNFRTAPGNSVFSINSGRFSELHRAIFNIDPPAGLTTLVGLIQSDPAINDLRWAAYMLATVKHECANTWKPIEEYGKGRKKEYGKPVKGPDGKSHAYFGRGFVQLTWKDNYEKMNKALRLSGPNDLVDHPERALDTTIAYKIMSYGMTNGSFTGKKLVDSIAVAKCDYVHARRIINGLDKANLIAGYAKRLELCLVAGI